MIIRVSDEVGVEARERALMADSAESVAAPVSPEAERSGSPTKRGPDGELVWGVCDGCGEDIAPEFLEAATNVPPDYMPEDFRKRATVILCELCRTEGE